MLEEVTGRPVAWRMMATEQLPCSGFALQPSLSRQQQQHNNHNTKTIPEHEAKVRGHIQSI
jgi:hypothetical protein